MKIAKSNFNIKVPYNNKPAYIIIHHALATNCTVLDVNTWHKALGWAGIGYHYFITKAGKVYTGRKEAKEGRTVKKKV